MCGRYLIEDEAYADILEILNNLNANKNTSGAGEFAKGEIFPASIAPVIAGDGILAVKWGFPHWKNSGVIINARAETALEKKMFGKPLRERRCVVPSSGFYEWGHGSDLSSNMSLFENDELPDSGIRSGGSKKKDKFLLRQPEDSMLYMAGIVSTFRDSFGEPYDAFVILTTIANDSVAVIHDRMPVILAPEEATSWVRDNAFMEFVLHRPGPELSMLKVG